MDSSTVLLHLLEKGYQVTAISFDYGQKHKVEFTTLLCVCLKSLDLLAWLSNPGVLATHIKKLTLTLSGPGGGWG